MGGYATTCIRQWNKKRSIQRFNTIHISLKTCTQCLDIVFIKASLNIFVDFKHMSDEVCVQAKNIQSFYKYGPGRHQKIRESQTKLYNLRLRFINPDIAK